MRAVKFQLERDNYPDLLHPILSMQTHFNRSLAHLRDTVEIQVSKPSRFSNSANLSKQADCSTRDCDSWIHTIATWVAISHG